MVSDVILNLERKYFNTIDQKIGRDFIQPCLKECKKYRRGTGTFSSSAFKSYIAAIDHFVRDDIKIEILCSPKIDNTLYRTLLDCNNEKERESWFNDLANNIVKIASGVKDNPHDQDWRSLLIAFLIANKKLEIKFAQPLNLKAIQRYEILEDDPDMEDINTRAMYHIKYGYFEFEEEIKVGFEGSVNETDTALSQNSEKASVYRSWVPGDTERLQDIIDELDADWDGKNKNIKIHSIDNETLDIIKQHVQKHTSGKRPERPEIPKPEPTPAPVPEQNGDDWKWRHKDEALKIFVEKKQGILAMATGTGKTTTATKIANYLFKHDLIDSLIVTMYGNPLLDQWYEELTSDGEIQQRVIIKHYSKEKRMQAFINNNKDKILLITSDQLGNLMNLIPEEKAKRILVVYDEVHDMAAPMRKQNTEGKHQKFEYRLGLSATPDRGEYDLEGNDFLLNEIGPIIFTFGLEEAIKRGILVEFDYEALAYELTEEENKKISRIIGSKNKPDSEGKKRSDHEIMMAIADVKKQASNKLLSFDDYLSKKGLNCLDRTIIFVHSKEFGSKVTQIINEKGFTSFNTFYDYDNDENLIKLANGTIQCLITCHKVSQGIDIKSLKNVIIFASSVQKRETIQRLGRVLRSEKNNTTKKAFMLDFCQVDEEKEGARLKSDTVRKQWLSALAKTKREE